MRLLLNNRVAELGGRREKGHETSIDMDGGNKGDKPEACRRLEMSLESWGQKSGQPSIAVR